MDRTDEAERNPKDIVGNAQLLENSIEFQAKHSMAQDAIRFFEKASGRFLSWCLVVTGFGLAVFFATYGAIDATLLFGAIGAFGAYRLIKAHLAKRN